MGLLEKISPKWALQRELDRQALSVFKHNAVKAGAYDGATDSRKRNHAAFSGKSKNTDEENALGQWDRSRLHLEIADLRRNYGIVYGLLDRFADFVVGNGIQIQAKTENYKWNEQAEDYFEEWENVCDYRQRLKLWQIQRLAIKSLFTDGECFFVFLSNGQIQPIESQRIQTPKDFASDTKVIQGIRIAKGGIPAAYYICDRMDNGYPDTSSYTSVAASNVLHFVNPDRVDQLRGVPILASVVSTLRDKKEFADATLMKSKLDSFKAWAIYSDKVGAGAMRTIPRDADEDGIEENEISIETNAEGQMWYLPKGDRMESLASKTPNAEYKNFNEIILKEIGAAMSIPYQVLMLDFENTSFSSSKAALTMASKTIQRYQKLITSNLLQRLWNWRIAKAVKDNELPPAPKDSNDESEWYWTTFIPSGLDWIDPQSEAAGNQLDYNMGVKSLSEICLKRGREYQEVLDEKTSEIEYAITKAKEINDKHGTNLSFRELIVSQAPGTYSNEQIKQQQNETSSGGK